MKTHVFKYIGKYGGGLMFTTDPAQISNRQDNGDEWEDLGEHDLPRSFLWALGWDESPIYTFAEWVSE